MWGPAEPDQILLQQGFYDLPNRLKRDIQLRSNVCDGMFAIAAFHNFKKTAMTFWIVAVIDPNTVPGAKYLTFETVDHELVALPSSDKTKHNLPGNF